MERGVRVGCGPLVPLGFVGVIVAFIVDAPWWVKVAGAVVAVLGLKIGRLVPGTGTTAHGDVWSQRRAVASLAADDPDRPRRLHELAVGLQSGIIATGKERPANRAAVVEAVAASREAVSLTPASDPERLSRLHTHQLNLLLHSVQRIMPSLDDEAVQVGRETVALSRAGDPRRPDELSNLGIVLFQRAGRDVGTVEECVQLFRDAIVAAADSGRDVAAYQPRLILALGLLAEVRGDLAALDEAVALTRTDAFLQVSRRQRAYSLAALSLTLFQSSVRRNNDAALGEAVAVTRQALEFVSRRDDALRVNLMGNLSAGLIARSAMLDDPALLHEAVKVSRRALLSQLTDKRYRHACLVGWGKALYIRHSRLGSARDLRKANRRIWLALLLTPADRRDRIEDLSIMAAIKRTRFEQTASEHDLRLAHQCAVKAAELARGTGGHRFHAIMAAELAVLAGRTDQALEYVEQAVADLSQFSSRRAGWIDRHHHYAGLGGLAATAAVAAVAAGRPERAVELLEQTRGVLLADSFDIRADSRQLAAAAPDLAAEFDRLRAEIDAADHAGSTAGLDLDLPPSTVEYEFMAQRRAGLDEQWRDLLARIRERPGLQSFLVPPDFAELGQEAGPGPIVYVVPSELGGLALIVADGGAEVVKLPSFTARGAAAMATGLTEALRAAGDRTLSSAERAAAQSEIAGILARLGELVTEPVLTRLGFTGPPPGDAWPRLWWCPVGPATQLPLHGAGRHVDGESVMDRVVSSYTPTIRALRHARASRDAGSGTTNAVLVVAVPEAPESHRLGGVVDEATAISRLVPAAAVLSGADATYDAVVPALATHRIAHLACHGVADLQHPAASRLLLHDHLQRPLTLPAIAGLRLDHGELAYLSACSTTGTHLNHADEAAHLAAAFQLAGYQAVIGTLWPIDDQAATSIAGEFYRHLTQYGEPDPQAAALALHHSLRSQRDRRPDHPTTWAAHLHLGR